MADSPDNHSMVSEQPQLRKDESSAFQNKCYAPADGAKSIVAAVGHPQQKHRKFCKLRRICGRFGKVLRGLEVVRSTLRRATYDLKRVSSNYNRLTSLHHEAHEEHEKNKTF